MHQVSICYGQPTDPVAFDNCSNDGHVIDRGKLPIERHVTSV
jgi:hypothetical protein